MNERLVDVAEQPERMDEVRSLFREYAEDMGLNLNFQGFEEELVGLPGRYAAPRGCIFFWNEQGVTAGCIALRPLEDDTGEVKRLFVRPEFRGTGIARKLVSELLKQAVERGYRRLRLDTLASMVPARRLYESFGFREIEAYYHNPLPDVIYYELTLSDIA